MDYRAEILKFLKQLKDMSTEGDENYLTAERLEKSLDSISGDQSKLFYVYQTIREIIDKETGGKGEAKFQVQTDDGVKEYNSLEEAKQDDVIKENPKPINSPRLQRH